MSSFALSLQILQVHKEVCMYITYISSAKNLSQSAIDRLRCMYLTHVTTTYIISRERQRVNWRLAIIMLRFRNTYPSNQVSKVYLSLFRRLNGRDDNSKKQQEANLLYEPIK